MVGPTLEPSIDLLARTIRTRPEQQHPEDGGVAKALMSTDTVGFLEHRDGLGPGGAESGAARGLDRSRPERVPGRRRWRHPARTEVALSPVARLTRPRGCDLAELPAVTAGQTVTAVTKAQAKRPCLGGTPHTSRRSV